MTVTNLYLFFPYTILAKVDTGSDVSVKIFKVGGMVCIMMYEKAIYKRFGCSEGCDVQAIMLRNNVCCIISCYVSFVVLPVCCVDIKMDSRPRPSVSKLGLTVVVQNKLAVETRRGGRNTRMLFL